MSNQVFKLFANCIPVKGYKRSIVYDLQRSDFSFIPNELFELLTDYKHLSKAELKDLYPDDGETIDEYYSFLIQKEYGFWCSREELNSFPDLQLTWTSPSLITNAILDIGNHEYDLKKVITELEDLGCKDIEVRIFTIKPLSFIEKILKLTDNTRFKSIRLVVKYNVSISEEDYERLLISHLRISQIVVNSSPFQKELVAKVKIRSEVLFTKEIIESSAHCGIIHVGFFSVNSSVFRESKNYNSCLNQKISIDIDGNIKNCPSMETTYGNIIDTSLHSALFQSRFKDLWNISKDQVKVCRDCEFRHMCSDCRVYIMDSNDLYSKPSKCNYNPYTASWIE